MAINYSKFLEDFDLQVLIRANEKFLPGLIVEKRGSAFTPVDDLRVILKDSGISFETELLAADLPDVIKGKSQVGGRGEISLPFISIGGGLDSGRFIDYEIGVVKECVFKDQKLALWARAKDQLKRIKKNYQAIWKDIGKHWLVMSTWYASAYSLSLNRVVPGDITAKVKASIEVGIGAKVTVNTEAKIVNVSRNDRVPFAFCGRDLRKIR